MLRIILSWELIVHELQGCTLEKAVIDIGRSLFAKEQAHVALSRVKSLDGLFVSSMDNNKLLTYPHDSGSLAKFDIGTNCSRRSAVIISDYKLI